MPLCKKQKRETNKYRKKRRMSVWASNQSNKSNRNKGDVDRTSKPNKQQQKKSNAVPLSNSPQDCPSIKDNNQNEKNNGPRRSSSSRAPPPITTVHVDRLVLGGGGNRVAGYLGALTALGDRVLNECFHFVGASAGSILATFLAMRCPVHRMVEQEELRPFEIPYSWYPSALWQFMWHRDGIISIDEIRQHLALVMNDFIPGCAELTTFESIYEDYGTTLEIQALDAETCKRFVFNHQYTPDALVLDAMCASSAIQGVFSSFYWRGRHLCDGAIVIPAPWGSLQHHHQQPHQRRGCVNEQYHSFLRVEDGEGGYLSQPETLGLFLDQYGENSSNTSSHNSDKSVQSNKSNHPPKTNQSIWHTLGETLMNSCITTDNSSPSSIESSPFSNSLTSISYNAMLDMGSTWIMSNLKSKWGSVSETKWSDFIPHMLLQPWRAIRHYEYGNHANSVGTRLQIPVDQTIHGSVLHALSPSPEQKDDLFRTGYRVVKEWKRKQKQKSQER